MAVDGSGTAYVVDDNAIRKVTASGVVRTLAGQAGSAGNADGTGSAARFWQPSGIAVDATGNAYVADTSNRTIRKVTAAGLVTTLAGFAGAAGNVDGMGTAARFGAPFGVAVDGTGTVYVADTGNHAIRKVTPSGDVTTLAGLAGSRGSTDGLAAGARFNAPQGIAVDGTGTVYVADTGNCTIRMLTAAGIVSTLAGLAGSCGSADGTGSAARFNSPGGLAVDGIGRLYVADTANHTIRQVTATGVVTTLAGLSGAYGNVNETGSAARFRRPSGVAVTEAGVVYLADTWNYVIRVGTHASTLPAWWKTQFGLDPFSDEGDDGPDGDPDGDGITNLQEFERGTHPRGFFTRYAAEGATGTFWQTRIALANPTGTDAIALLRFLRPRGAPVTLPLVVPAMGRRTVDPGELPGLAGEAFSTVIESDVLLVVDRTMRWDSRGYGGHAESSVASPGPVWYLAEGHTQPFDLFYLIQNPNPSAVSVEVTYLRPAPAPPLVQTYEIAAESRFNIYVNWIPELEGTAVSAVLRTVNGGGIIVERSMYLGSGSRAGHASAGVTAPATQWFLAEGATGFFFDFFILLANPTETATVVDARFLREDGVVVETAHPLPAQSRANIYVNTLHPQLADAAMSTVLMSRHDVPVIVERAMYWDRRGLPYEAHNSPGATQTGTRWGLADGEAGLGTDTYILVANTSAFAGRVKMTLLFEDGGTAEREFALLPNSRLTVFPPQHFPEANGRRFGALIDSLGDEPVQIVVERAMYSSVGGVFWEAGTNVLGTRLH